MTIPANMPSLVGNSYKASILNEGYRELTVKENGRKESPARLSNSRF